MFCQIYVFNWYDWLICDFVYSDDGKTDVT